MRISSALFSILLLTSSLFGSALLTTSYKDWSLSEAIEMLTESSWTKQETYTRVVGGIGSGIQGEKEIFNTFFVRFLSASPIREAYARVREIQVRQQKLSPEEKSTLEDEIKAGVNLDVHDWIVVAVSFRSNNPRQESSVASFFEGQTTATIKTRAYLSTERFPQVPLEAYFPPKENSVGAKFVFPRKINGTEIVTPEDDWIIFELDAPGADPQLRTTFSVKEMLVDGKLVI